MRQSYSTRGICVCELKRRWEAKTETKIIPGNPKGKYHVGNLGVSETLLTRDMRVYTLFVLFRIGSNCAVFCTR
jgi:hypothetical protein